METPKEHRTPVSEEKLAQQAPKEVFEEKNDKPAAKMIKWAIIIAVIILILIYFFMFYDRDIK